MTADRTKAALCPICRRPAVAALRPFCSRRCADVDLGRWLTGEYRVAGTDGESEEAETEESA